MKYPNVTYSISSKSLFRSYHLSRDSNTRILVSISHEKLQFQSMKGSAKVTILPGYWLAVCESVLPALSEFVCVSRSVKGHGVSRGKRWQIHEQENIPNDCSYPTRFVQESREEIPGTSPFGSSVILEDRFIRSESPSSSRLKENPFSMEELTGADTRGDGNVWSR